MLTALIERCMKRRGVKDSDPYDWEKVETTVQPNVTSNSFAANMHNQLKNTELHQGTNSIDTDVVALGNNSSNQIAFKIQNIGKSDSVGSNLFTHYYINLTYEYLKRIILNEYPDIYRLPGIKIATP